MKKLKIAMLGFGGIARAHYSGYKLLERLGAPISLEAVFDCNPAQFERELKINIEPKPIKLDEGVRRYTDLDELFAKEEFDMADVCLPSYLHKSFSVRSLREGKHVLCEKPMALSSAECEEMLAAAKESGKRLMVAQCLRFDPEYLYLKKAVKEKTFGKLLRLEMNRLCAHPSWGYENWFADTEKSGGCILDMHIHDVDMARFLLGEPQAVSTVAYDGISRWAFESTRLFYPDVR
jgi:predicted dehydrogenase